MYAYLKYIPLSMNLCQCNDQTKSKMAESKSMNSFVFLLLWDMLFGPLRNELPTLHLLLMKQLPVVFYRIIKLSRTLSRMNKVCIIQARFSWSFIKQHTTSNGTHCTETLLKGTPLQLGHLTGIGMLFPVQKINR